MEKGMEFYEEGPEPLHNPPSRVSEIRSKLMVITARSPKRSKESSSLLWGNGQMASPKLHLTTPMEMFKREIVHSKMASRGALKVIGGSTRDILHSGERGVSSTIQTGRQQSLLRLQGDEINGINGINGIGKREREGRKMKLPSLNRITVSKHPREKKRRETEGNTNIAVGEINMFSDPQYRKKRVGLNPLVDGGIEEGEERAHMRKALLYLQQKGTRIRGKLGKLGKLGKSENVIPNSQEEEKYNGGSNIDIMMSSNVGGNSSVPLHINRESTNPESGSKLNFSELARSIARGIAASPSFSSTSTSSASSMSPKKSRKSSNNTKNHPPKPFLRGATDNINIPIVTERERELTSSGMLSHRKLHMKLNTLTSGEGLLVLRPCQGENNHKGNTKRTKKRRNTTPAKEGIQFELSLHEKIVELSNWIAIPEKKEKD